MSILYICVCDSNLDYSSRFISVSSKVRSQNRTAKLVPVKYSYRIRPIQIEQLPTYMKLGVFYTMILIHIINTAILFQLSKLLLLTFILRTQIKQTHTHTDIPYRIHLFAIFHHSSNILASVSSHMLKLWRKTEHQVFCFFHYWHGSLSMRFDPKCMNIFDGGVYHRLLLIEMNLLALNKAIQYLLNGSN